MSTANAFGGPASGWLQAQAMMSMDTCMVRLVDRRTGAAHRVNGKPLTVFTRNPNDAAAALLSGRDPAIWEARIEPLNRGGSR